MAHIDGYVTLPVDSYNSFRNAVLGNEYDADGAAGCQCVDMPKELNYNLGFRYPYWDTGGTGYAYGGWTVLSARNFNAGNKYILIYNKSDIKRGDMIVLNRTASSTTGHVCFADEDYNGTDRLACLGQRQNGIVENNISNINLANFLGAFRNIDWNRPTPVTTFKRSHFPWVLYARKLRSKRALSS